MGDSVDRMTRASRARLAPMTRDDPEARAGRDSLLVEAAVVEEVEEEEAPSSSSPPWPPSPPSVPSVRVSAPAALPTTEKPASVGRMLTPRNGNGQKRPAIPRSEEVEVEEAVVAVLA
jgi:hypothetical protein